MSQDLSIPPEKDKEKDQEKADAYVIFLREIAALKSRMDKGADLERADTSRFISIHLLEDLIKKSGETPDDKFYQRHRFKKGRASFVEAHKEVALALLPKMYEGLASPQEPTQKTETCRNFIRFIEAIYESELPTSFPPSPKLVAATRAGSPENFADTFNQYAESYATYAIRKIANELGLTHIPEDSIFAKDPSLNAGLNYVFTHATEHEFWCIATAIELSGTDFDEKDWTDGILLEKEMLPDISLDLK